MPITKNVDATDDLIVVFDDLHKIQTFEITILNGCDDKQGIKKIGIGLPFVRVVNFDQDDAIIESGNEKTYLFETEFVPTLNPNEGKIRFTFADRTHITRTVRTVYKPLTNMFKITDAMKDDGWIKEFHEKYPSDIEITDDLNIEFDQPDGIQFLDVSIKNHTRTNYHLKSVTTSQETVKWCRNQTDGGLRIRPKSELELHFQADYVPNKAFSVVQLTFDFRPSVRISRTLRIIYQKRLLIQRNTYDIPIDLQELIFSERRISRSKLLDSLDTWAARDYSDQDYGRHFHNLLYLDEIGLSKEMKEKYYECKGHFGDRPQYEHGEYDLVVNDLFETRPSLQLGKLMENIEKMRQTFIKHKR